MADIGTVRGSLTDLAAIGERHRPEGTDGDESEWCVFDRLPWPCDSVQALAHIDALAEAVVELPAFTAIGQWDLVKRADVLAIIRGDGLE